MPQFPDLFTGELVQSRRIIYQPSQFAVENLIYLQETGNLTAVKPHVSSRKGLASYLFFVVVRVHSFQPRLSPVKIATNQFK